MTSLDPRSTWKRLEETLLAIKPGETVTVEALAAECGLARETVEQVLAAVVVSELFERTEDGRVCRRALLETTTSFEPDGRASIGPRKPPKGELT
jgi:Holliday junction resolvasome RuvABC ATP-dependent DNA helicase subunit